MRVVRLISTLAPVAGMVLFVRWGLNRSTPDQDARQIKRLIGRMERAATRFSAACTRLWVRMRAALGWDEMRWEYLRWKWQQGGYSLDS